MLDGLKTSSFQDFEILVADDASPLGAAVSAVAQEAAAELVRLDRRSGPAAARNAAAKKATGDILIFLDADTSVHSDTLERFAKKFRATPNLDAAMGSYDQQPTAPGVVSRFRNLLHSFVHHRANPLTTTFWAGCGAVRRERFQELGGFDESFLRPSIEDIEFGLRLSVSGGLLHLDPQIQVTHHKRWSMTSMVQTDLFGRAIPWASMLHKHPLPRDLNFGVRDRISVMLAVLTLLFTIVASLHGGRWWLAPVTSLTLIALLGWPFFRFLARATSWGEAVLSFPLLFIYLITCATGLIGGIMFAEHRRDRWLWPVAATIGFVLLALQIFGGSFDAEFDGHPDEAAQFISGLIIYDYLANLPSGNPIAWAGQYYLHYPEVAIGHCPPGYHLIEAVWWLFVGPSRMTSILLQWIIGVAALTVLYRLCRSALPLPITALIIALVIAAPVFQQGLEQTMSDLCALLWSILVVQAVVRLVNKQDLTAWFLVVLWLLLAALTKGTAVCLAPVPVVALVASRQSIRVPSRVLVAGVGCLLAAAAWYVSTGCIRALGGMSFDVPWPGRLIAHLAGWGFLVLAMLGIQRQPLALVSASVIACTLGVSVVVRAMQEERHWIITLPAILVLSGFGVCRLRVQAVAIGLLLAGAAIFPFARYYQPPSEFGKLVRQLVLPSRMLVSSAAWGEGSWIAACSLAEQRPASFIIRATKALAQNSWSDEGYRMVVATPEAVARRLDELAVEIVILHTPFNQNPRPHHALLRQTITESPAWGACGSAQNLLAYCRIAPSQAPRQPLRLSVYGFEFEEWIRP
jgi:GT2 family glycosyltransferase